MISLALLLGFAVCTPLAGGTVRSGRFLGPPAVKTQPTHTPVRPPNIPHISQMHEALAAETCTSVTHQTVRQLIALWTMLAHGPGMAELGCHWHTSEQTILVLEHGRITQIRDAL